METVVGDSPSEPEATPQTPSKPRQERLFLTPSKVHETPTSPPGSPDRATSFASSGTTGISQCLAMSTLSTDTLTDDEDDEFHDWSTSGDEELSKVAEGITSNAMPPPVTPRKAIKSDPFSTPGKRGYDEMSDDRVNPWPTPSTGRKKDDIFTTPSTNARGLNLFARSGLLSPMDTPTPHRFKDVLGQESGLTNEILEALHSHQIVLSPEIQSTIKSIGNKHSLYTYGVIKGRDVSRSLLQKRNEKIAELESEIAVLQAERETNKAVIRHLRRVVEIENERKKTEE